MNARSILLAGLLLPSSVVALSACAPEPKCPPPAPGIDPNFRRAQVESAPTPAAPPPGVFHIEVARDGGYSIEGVHVTDLRELGERARASAKQRPDLLVIVAADKETPFGPVLAAHDLAKQSGFQRVMIAEGRMPPVAAPAPTAKSVPGLVEGDSWKCNVAMKVDRLEDKSVFVAIHVGPDGVPQTVDVLEDPGYGLGDAAKICVLNKSFKPAVDAKGQPTVGVKKLRLFFQQR